MDVFALFTNTEYQFLTVSQTELGNEILTEYTGYGVFKQRDAMTQATNIEQYAGNDATLHIKPTEPFITALAGQLVGNGVRVSKNDAEALEYRIQQVDEGFNFDTNELEFYKLRLTRESFATWQATPLE